MNNEYDVVIVGGGHSGTQLCTSLRKHNFKGSIALISEEAILPYNRPSLSKEYLAGKKTIDRITLKSESFWHENEIQVFLDHKVVSVEPSEQKIVCQNGQQFFYNNLVWATGGTPKKPSWPGVNAKGVHVLRSKQDTDKLLVDLENTNKAVIVGAGYIGLETAAVLKEMNIDVTIIETQDRVLSRVAGNVISSAFEGLHKSNNIDFRFNISVSEITHIKNRANGIILSDGSHIKADIVIVGIGIDPNVKPLVNAGIDCQNGVRINSHCQTSVENILAIGDCAEHSNPYAENQFIRLESVQNAIGQANVAANTICGTPKSYNELPWFWSNQYNWRLQTVGLSTGYDEEILRGDLKTGKFSVIYLKDGRIIALDCVNSVKDFMQGKKLVELQKIVDPSLLAKNEIALKDFH